MTFDICQTIVAVCVRNLISLVHFTFISFHTNCRPTVILAAVGLIVYRVALQPNIIILVGRPIRLSALKSDMLERYGNSIQRASTDAGVKHLNIHIIQI